VPRARRRRVETHWGARLLAPAAFLAAATVAVLLIRAGLDPTGEPTTTQPPHTTRSGETTTQPAATRPRRRVSRTYTIRAGDTFETIASDRGTTVEELQALNPDVDPNSLQVGQKIVIPG
jgi:LysM repeat protein